MTRAGELAEAMSETRAGEGEGARIEGSGAMVGGKGAAPLRRSSWEGRGLGLRRGSEGGQDVEINAVEEEEEESEENKFSVVEEVFFKAVSDPLVSLSSSESRRPDLRISVAGSLLQICCRDSRIA
eukprot:444670-Hanusia_phi.AAC.1